MNSELLVFHVIPDDESMRIDKYLAGQIDHLSRSYLQRLLREERVVVNGCPVKANYKAMTDDEIQIQIPRDQEPEIKPEDIVLDILYEDEDLLVVNKPKDMVVHPAAGHYSHTLVNALMFHCGNSLSGINGILRPGIVHRIDKDTTGALAVCKNDLAHQSLAAQFAVHSISRKYRAIVHGNLKEDRGDITAAIGRHPTERKKMAAHVKHGKSAVTHYRVLERLKGYTYVECTLETGRTHQIRVHMSAIGHPLLGDELYGPKKCPVKNLRGQTLHAMTLGFVHPKTGCYLECTAPLPTYFEELLLYFSDNLCYNLYRM